MIEHHVLFFNVPLSRYAHLILMRWRGLDIPDSSRWDSTLQPFTPSCDISTRMVDSEYFLIGIIGRD